MKIAILGKMRSGKDTFAKFLIDNYEFNRFAFGDGIKQIISEFFPYAFDNGKPRHYYQVIGQTFRELNPDVWVDFLDLELGDLLYFGDGTENIIVTDCRQPNEYEYLKDMGFTFIKITCDEELRLQRIAESGDNFAAEDLNHETEQHIDGFECDYLIENNGTVEELCVEAFLLYLQMKGK